MRSTPTQERWRITGAVGRNARHVVLLSAVSHVHRRAGTGRMRSSRPKGTGATISALRSRDAFRREWLEIWSPAPVRFFGAHQVKMGTSLTVSTDHGQFRLPARRRSLNSAGQLLERIDFANQGPYKRTDLEFTGYAQDHWSLSSRAFHRHGDPGRTSKAGVESADRSPRRDLLDAVREAEHGFSHRLRAVLRPHPARRLRIQPLSRAEQLPCMRRTAASSDSPTPFSNVIGSVIGPEIFSGTWPARCRSFFAARRDMERAGGARGFRSCCTCALSIPITGPLG